MIGHVIETVRLILSDFLITYPGAFIRYVVSGKKELEEYLEDDMEYNIISVLSTVAFFVLMVNLYRLVNFY